jgi:hypothetical protein
MKKAFCAAVKAGSVAVALFVWVGGGAAEAQKSEDTRTLVVIGSAAVQGGNVTAARDAAIASSLMNAVALAAIEMLSPEGVAENFKRLNQQLLAQPDAFIQDYRLLSEAAAANQHRVVVQATVAVKRIRDQLAGAGFPGGKTATASSAVALTVEGSSNLANFVKFRKTLVGILGVEGIQVREMKPNETTLLVTYRGTAEDLAAALSQQSFDTFTCAVRDAGEGALRVALTSK